MSDSKKAPIWFTALAAILLLWNIMGVLSFVTHLLITDEAIALLQPAEQALYGEYPSWIHIVFCIAVSGGFIGALLLVFKRKFAKLLFNISFLAILIQMTHNIFMTSSIEVYGPVQALLMPIMVIVFGAICIWLAHLGIKKGWLK